MKLYFKSAAIVDKFGIYSASDSHLLLYYYFNKERVMKEQKKKKKS